MYSQDEIKFWIAGATGNVGTNVDPGVCASIARAMIDYNRMYANSFLLDTQINVPEEFTGRHEGAEVDKDDVFHLQGGCAVPVCSDSSWKEQEKKYVLSLRDGLVEYQNECELQDADYLDDVFAFPDRLTIFDGKLNKIIWMILGTWLAILAMVVGVYTILSNSPI